MAVFDTVLVANRGEIACRVIRTLGRLGIRSIAVYTASDRGAKHIGLADSALLIGSYLDAAAIVEAAVTSGAQAVHPGYGFLSENVDFARSCTSAGVAFIGPDALAIEVMGDKIRAKEHVAARGVPVIPGAGVAGMTDEQLVAASKGVGFPLLIKPSAGGGGKGMTVVSAASELPAALEASRRVATKAFGDDSLLLERLVATPRHIEVQVLADAHGHVIHLGERECSLQRRHQKIVEEAPSPLLDDATRSAIGEAAREVARSVDYVGAGTVEFLVSDAEPGEFFFMEMNTRLQVEHPVTELAVSIAGARGIDLVEWQLRIAAGEPLTITQGDVAFDGHAIEARLYAEDPAAGFLPATGTVLRLREAEGDGVRVDSCLVEGLVVASDYDPMLAKVIAWGVDRGEALARLERALAETVVLGVRTNLGFLRELVANADVRAGRLDTGLIERTPFDSLEIGPTLPVPDDAPASGGRAVGSAARATAALIEHSAAWHTDSPWARPSGWRIGAHRPARYHVPGPIDVLGPPQEALVDGRDTRFAMTAQTATIELDGATTAFDWARGEASIWLSGGGHIHELRVPDRVEVLAAHRSTLSRVAGAVNPEVRTAMPGTVVAVTAITGDVVEAGQPLLTIEAMKMEHTMLASVAGVVTLTVSSGDLVGIDQVVARIDPHEGAP
ncbi:MAG: acetyl/propionyl CoA carboxylase alpha subunit [Rhodoglobus sp.]|nr:acetyl/propionyl CoA carboxylase alpha subunit [Rhodoglobus sp.]